MRVTVNRSTRRERSLNRRGWHVSIAVILPLVLALSGLAWGEEPGPWDAPDLGIRLSPPRGWSLAPGQGPGSLEMVPPDGGGKFAFLGLPLPEPADGPPDLDALTAATIESLDQNIDKFKLMGQRELTVAGLPAREIYVRGKVAGEKIRWVHTLFVHRGHQVNLTYAAKVKVYMTHIADYDQLVRSVRLVP